MKTSISFKAFLVAAAIASPFGAEARGDLRSINKNIDIILSNMETDFANQDDNVGNGSTLSRGYQKKFGDQLEKLQSLLKQASRLKGGSRGDSKGDSRRGASRRNRNSAVIDDAEIAPPLAALILALKNGRALDELEDDDAEAAQDLLDGVGPIDSKTDRRIAGALKVLDQS